MNETKPAATVPIDLLTGLIDHSIQLNRLLSALSDPDAPTDLSELEQNIERAVQIVSKSDGAAKP